MLILPPSRTGIFAPEGSEEPGAKIPFAHDMAIWDLQWHPAGHMLATVDTGGLLFLWDTNIQKTTAILSGHSSWGLDVAFHPVDPNRLVSSGVGEILVWDLTKSNPLIKRLIAHNDRQVWQVAFHPSGGLLASCGEDGTLVEWDTSTWQPVAKPHKLFADGCLAAEYSPNRPWIAASSSSGEIVLVNASGHQGVKERFHFPKRDW